MSDAPRLQGGASNEGHGPPARPYPEDAREAVRAYEEVRAQREPAPTPRRWEYLWVDGEGLALVDVGSADGDATYDTSL